MYQVQTSRQTVLQVGPARLADLVVQALVEGSRRVAQSSGRTMAVEPVGQVEDNLTLVVVVASLETCSG